MYRDRYREMDILPSSLATNATRIVSLETFHDDRSWNQTRQNNHMLSLPLTGHVTARWAETKTVAARALSWRRATRRT